MKNSILKLDDREYDVTSDGKITRLPFSFIIRSNGCRAIKKAIVLRPYSTPSGYLRVALRKRLYFVHRIVWMSFCGRIPLGFEVDHINGKRDDNRIENLRIVTRRENSLNRQRANKNSKSGSRGVYFHRRCKKWSFSYCGKQIAWTSDKEIAIQKSKKFHGK